MTSHRPHEAKTILRCPGRSPSWSHPRASVPGPRRPGQGRDTAARARYATAGARRPMEPPPDTPAPRHRTAASSCFPMPLQCRLPQRRFSLIHHVARTPPRSTWRMHGGAHAHMPHRSLTRRRPTWIHAPRPLAWTLLARAADWSLDLAAIPDVTYPACTRL